MSNNEAERIYSSIFKKQIPPGIKHHFELVSTKIEPNYSRDEINTYHKLINKFSDLVAIEFTSRYKKSFPLLTEKFNIMISLAETDPDNYYLYHNKKDSLILGYLRLIVIPFLSVYKFLKGFVLISLFPVK